MLKWERVLFWLAYVRQHTPWDTNITPPELVRTIEGPNHLAPGRALDLGCGTGTNVIYLAQHGWDAVGVDFVSKAVRQARDKARTAGVSVRFFAGDVTRLADIEGLAGRFDLVVDIGCLHSLSPADRKPYAEGLMERMRPGATFILYAWGPRSGAETRRTISPDQVSELFAPRLQLLRTQKGEERGRPSNWYWFANAAEI
jgi:cyclopropane fatty-acyl-phospholipid synthase-like methyltransferase